MVKAGILEDGIVSVSEKGTGQGSVISPLLANIYLHYALDLWAARWRRREATGDMIIVRYADDFIVGFQHESDARRFLEEMRERLGKFRAVTASREDPADRVRTLCGGTPKAARAWQAGDLQLPGLHLHLRQNSLGQIPNPTEDQAGPHAGETAEDQGDDETVHAPADPRAGELVGRVVRGYFNYHAVPTNALGTDVFRHHVTDLWRRTLRRRSQKDRITWARMTQLVDDWLPKPIILHPWPSDRFAVTHPRWEKLWGGRRRSWHLPRPYEPMEVAPWPKSMISAEA